jgi:hypothetical protein
MIEPSSLLPSLPEPAISRRRLLAFSALTIPTAALLTGAVKKADPKTTPSAEAPQPTPTPTTQVYFC